MEIISSFVFQFKDILLLQWQLMSGTFFEEHIMPKVRREIAAKIRSEAHLKNRDIEHVDDIVYCPNHNDKLKQAKIFRERESGMDPSYREWGFKNKRTNKYYMYYWDRMSGEERFESS